MKRAALTLPILFLVGCGYFSNTFLTEQEQAALTPAARLFQLQGEMNIALTQINVYSSQPFCSDTLILACADRQVVIQAARIATEANGAVRGAQAAVRAGAVDSALLASGARVAVARLGQYLLAKGVAQ